MSGRAGLVVAGAGARGAYEAGALSVLVPRMAARGAQPRVLVGTSAGALNVVGLASLAHLPPDEAAQELVRMWQHVRIAGVFAVAPGVIEDVTRFAGQLLGLPTRLPSLLDTRPQRQTLSSLVSIEQLHENVTSGPVDAVAVATTSAATGGTVVFVEKKPSVPLPPNDDRRNITYVDTKLTIDHVLASAAVPVAFRPVHVPTPRHVAGWYLDGGIRLNVPLKPALDLDCDQLGVVATQPASWPEQRLGVRRPSPDVFRATAVSLQALMGDRMVEDLRTLSTVNELVAAGAKVDRYRRVRFLFAGPPSGEADAIGRLANDVFRATYAGLGAVRNPTLWALGRLIGGRDSDHGELLSFLFFDSAFTTPAAALGAEHARRTLPRREGWQTALGGSAYIDLTDERASRRSP